MMTTISTPPFQVKLKSGTNYGLITCTSTTPTSVTSWRTISKPSIGLRCSATNNASPTAVYKVKLIGPDGEESEFEAPGDTYVLESAENAGLELPYSCRAGTCSTCAGKIVAGSVDQSEGSFLSDEQMEEGYVLTCTSYPTSDCVIYTHKESEVH